MTHKICTFAAAAALGATALLPSAASAQVARGAPALAQAQAQDSAVQTVQWRRHGHWRHHHRGHGWGPALGGFAAGAIIGGAIASQQQQQDWVAYCSSKYQSFNPATGTYINNRGQERPCR